MCKVTVYSASNPPAHSQGTQAYTLCLKGRTRIKLPSPSIQHTIIEVIWIVYKSSSTIYRYEEYRGTRCATDDPSTHHMKTNRTASSERRAFAEIFGLDPEDIAGETKHYATPYQNIGSVEMRQGRLVTFPNVMEHRLLPFELVDPSKRGHHRCITLYLVDPHYRICSTRNVPPQQPGWWARAVSPILMKEGGLPREVADEISLYNWPMTEKRARKLKEKKKRELGWSDMARRCLITPYDF